MTQITISVPAWNVQEETGYTPITTYWQDFSIAERFGAKAILDTFKKQFPNGKFVYDYKYLTEFVMVLNHKLWSFWDEKKGVYVGPGELYQDLFYAAENYAREHLKGEELEYYYQVTD